MVRVADCKSVVARLSRFNSYLSHQQLKGRLIMDKEMFIQLMVGITAAVIVILGGSYLVLLLPLPPF